MSGFFTVNSCVLKRFTAFELWQQGDQLIVIDIGVDKALSVPLLSRAVMANV